MQKYLSHHYNAKAHSHASIRFYNKYDMKSKNNLGLLGKELMEIDALIHLDSQSPTSFLTIVSAKHSVGVGDGSIDKTIKQ